MRTTITLDPDVELLIRRAISARGLSFKEAVNTAIRAGLTIPTDRKTEFKQRTFQLGAEQQFRWAKALETAAAMEDEELVRKLSMRK